MMYFSKEELELLTIALNSSWMEGAIGHDEYCMMREKIDHQLEGME